MKHLKVILIALLFCSCNSNSDFEGVDLKQYFFEVSDYETPKVLEYDFDSVGVKSKSYYLINKSNDNEIKMTKFNKDFEETEYYTILFKPDGAYTIEASFVEDQHTKLITNVEIQQGLTFAYKDYKTKMKAENSFKLQLGDSISIKTKSSWEFNEIAEKVINGIKIKTIIANGSSKRIVTNSKNGAKEDYRIKMEIWYSKGIGVTKLKMDTPFGTYIEDYLRTMTIDEFETMRAKN